MEKLEGIITAVEAESKQPNPTHANLARLVAMFMRETKEAIDTIIASINPVAGDKETYCVDASNTDSSDTTTEVLIADVPEKPKRKKPKAH